METPSIEEINIAIDTLLSDAEPGTTLKQMLQHDYESTYEEIEQILGIEDIDLDVRIYIIMKAQKDYEEQRARQD